MFENDQMSVGSWFLYFVLMAIPLLNLIMFFVILLNSSTNRSLKNYMILQLILVAIGFVFLILFWAAIIAALGSVDLFYLF